MADQKEVHFFDRHFEKGETWYKQQFRPDGRHVAIGEATPNYVHDERALARIAEMLPSVKLIMLIRDPVDRAYSHYWHNVSRGKETLAFEDAIAAEETRTAGSAIDRAVYSYVDRGRYLDQLHRVLLLFPADALHVYLYEDLRDDPMSTLSKIWVSIGVDPATAGHLGAFDRFNSYVEFRSVRIRNLAKRFGGPVGRVVGRLNAVKSVAYPPMRPETRRDLRALFDGANNGLEREFRLDTSSWRDDPPS